VNQQGCICVFAKPPLPGKVKTRLAPVAGSEGAAALAEAFLQDTWALVSSLQWAKPVVASTSPFVSPVVAGASEVWAQGDGDLGARLERILQRALTTSTFAIAIGADSPGLPAEFLEQARTALQKTDAVIGPCEDGGFYLLGLRQCPSGVFGSIPWSESSTCEHTLARLKVAGLSVTVLDPWFDVDRPEDLARLRTMILKGRIHAPRTRELLQRFSRCGVTSTPSRVSVIVPVLNERECLPITLGELQKLNWIHEVIVVDGGSTDGTREWLSEQNFAHVVDAWHAKGAQINAGAKIATGDVLLFLHADCLLPPDADGQIQGALRATGAVGGCFRVRFAERRPRSLRVVAAGINLRSRLTSTGTGDQAIFVCKRTFEDVGDGPDWPLFEDVELVRRIKKLGQFIVTGSAVTVSPRRYLRLGVWKTVFLIYTLRAAFWLGVPPTTLKKWFNDVRPHLMDKTPEHPITARERKASHAANSRL